VSGYFRVGTKDDTLFHYVWADNVQHAIRSVETHFDMALTPQRIVAGAIRAEDVPEGDQVINEPEQMREEREDAYG
jgi:hypothetical protein